MRIIKILLAAFLLFSSFDFVTYATASEAVTLTDPSLEAAVRAEINKPSGGITQNDVQGLIYLDFSKKKIKSIEGIQSFTNLESINLSDNQIADLKPLQNLAKLKSLFLTHNEITNISSLKNLKKLELLDLRYNKLKDISTLSSMTSVRELYLGNNAISDYTPLKNIYNLLLDKDFTLNKDFTLQKAQNEQNPATKASEDGNQPKTDTGVNVSIEKLQRIMDEIDNTIMKFNEAIEPFGSPLLGSPSRVPSKTVDDNGNIIADYHYANGTIASINNYIDGVTYTTFYRTGSGSLRSSMTVTTFGSQKEGFDANQVYNDILQGKYDFKKNPSNVILIHLTDTVYKMDLSALKTILSNKYATDKELSDFINKKNSLESSHVPIRWIAAGYLKSPADGNFYGCAIKYYSDDPVHRTIAGNTRTFNIPMTVYSDNSNVSGYVKGSTIGMNSGHSTMTVDNSKNKSSVLGKLYSVSGGKLSLARRFYVNKGESFTLESLSSGTYELHYGFVSAGNYYKTDRIKITETASSYTKCTLTLYTVTSGNTRVYKIKSSEF